MTDAEPLLLTPEGVPEVLAQWPYIVGKVSLFSSQSIPCYILAIDTFNGVATIVIAADGPAACERGEVLVVAIDKLRVPLEGVAP